MNPEMKFPGGITAQSFEFGIAVELLNHPILPELELKGGRSALTHPSQ